MMTSIEELEWRQRHQRLDALKASQYPEQKNDGVKEMMDDGLYEVTKEDNVDAFIDELELVSSQSQLSLMNMIFNHVSPSANNLLHVASSCGSKEIAELLVSHFPCLIAVKNFQGDTALHVAARAGMLNTSTIFINYAVNYKESYGLLRMRNEKGNTPLHEAVINKHHEVAEHLVFYDHQVAYWQNGENALQAEEKGKSPLYLAAENGDEKMLDILLQGIARDGDIKSLLQGRSPAHAAVMKKNLDILTLMVNRRPELLQFNDMGENPIHFASSIGYLKGVQFLLKNYRKGTIEKNEEGLYPIHVACKKGKLEVVKELLKQWRDPMDFLNEKGQNILHVAALNGRKNVVEYILGDDRFQELVNQRDKDGNTPLHLATKHNRPTAVYALVRDRRVLQDALNNENMTPYGEAQRQSKKLDQNAEPETQSTKLLENLEIPISDGKV
ncbi:hypothetical protein GH714_043570 [Hevea brasiliensis]|uniref:Uncharacterized protein n=1 Tax=Hevea brasiliensis TaxID=3981 RepID=A0A6A6K4L8_HEVBR|nr:hypothetical protein GH714_043570 [Hevea brasiliensis]